MVQTELDAELVRAKLQTRQLGTTLHFLRVTDSTQAVAQRMAQEGAAEGLVVFADEQTAGKGRHDHKWESPAGVNLYFSLLLKPQWPLSRANELQFLCAVGAAQALKKACGLTIDLKWPNDLWCKGKKLGGIILTSFAIDPQQLDFVIMGMGLNLNVDPKTFHPVVQKLATSVLKESGKEIDRAAFLAMLLQEIEDLYDEHKSQGFEAIRERWQALALQAGGKPVQLVDALTFPGHQSYKTLKGKAHGIDDHCHLIVETGDGKRLAIGDGTLV